MIGVVGLVVATAACGGTAVETGTPQPAPDPAPAVVPENADFIPVGAHIVVELDETLTTDTDVGSLFNATVKEPLMASNGAEVIPEGTVLTGMVTGTEDPDGLDEPGVIRLNFTRIALHGASHPISGTIIDVDVDIEDRNWEDVAEKAGIGAAAGMVLGAIVGGDLRDALIGGALGAGAGTIVSLGFGDDGALPRGTDITLQTTTPVDLGR
jgi:hypothetical protein